MDTIDKLFNRLSRGSARHVKHIELLDQRILLHCSNPIFLERLEKTYARTTAVKRTVPDFSDDGCVIDSCHSCPGWADMLPDEPVRIMEDRFVGSCRIYEVPDGLVLRQSKGWIVFRSNTGAMVFLNERPLAEDGRNRWPNPTGLVSILFGEMLARSNKWLVHAGAAGKMNGCHLWTGLSGVGKTTRTLAHIAKGYEFFGDDLVILGKGTEDEKWRVWPYWRPIHITRHTYELLPDLHRIERPFLKNRKSSIEIEELFQVSPPEAAPLIAIWLMTAEEGGGFRKLDFQEAFAALRQNFMHGFWPETAKANLDAVLDIIDQVPVFRLSRTTPLGLLADELYGA